MTIQCDSREQKFKHVTDHFDLAGIKWFVSKMVVGDYMDMSRPMLCIDRKHNLEELCGNLTTQHDRFRAELNRAIDLGIRLIFLVEHSKSIRCLSDVRHWVNPRLKVSPMSLTGFELYRRLCTIENKYRTEFHFCAPEEAGQRIIQLLSQNIPESKIERR